jgi:hypothetical protein
MGRYASDSGSATFTPAPVGTHIARCFRIVDLGTQHGEYKGKPTRRNQILVTWELPDETFEFEGEQRPMTASRFYTNSLGEKANLRQDLEQWRGRAFTDAELAKFDLETILGKPCMITIVGKENGKTGVAGVSGMPKNMECPPQINKSSTLWLDEFDEEKFEALSDGIKNIIKKSEEWHYLQDGVNPADMKTRNESESPDFSDDDIPF